MSDEEKKSADSSVLYLDADTEITEAIEKLKKSSKEEVRIVVPSRSGLLQSSVNVKLMKKAAKDSKKQLVLVTNDKLTKNLAGAAGIAVASSVKAMPHVPEVEKLEDLAKEEIRIEAPKEPEESKASKESKSISSSDDGFQPKHISLDESEEEPIEEEAKKPKKAKDKKVPDYGKLNKRIWIGVGVGVVILLLIVGYIFIPSAKVDLIAQAKKTSLNFNFILDTTNSSSDFTAQTLAAQKLETTKDVNFEVSATGKKEIGNKATGTVSVRNCDDVSTHNLPAGTGMTGGGKSFVTAQAVTIPAGSAGGGVVNCSSAVDVQITATAPGDSFNVGPTSFSLNGFSSLYKGTGQTSGGTSKTVTVLSADDIAGAKKKAQEEGKNATDELQKKAGSNQFLFTSTVQSDLAEFNSSVQQDNEADKVTVNAKLKYTGFAAKTDDVNKLFDDQVREEIKGNKEVYQNGATEGKYSVVKQFSPEKVQLNVKTSGFYGDPIDKKAVAKSMAGKPKKDASDIAKKAGEQITGAQVDSWPSLMPNMPILASKITINIKVSTE
jgi:hypothetical protein